MKTTLLTLFIIALTGLCTSGCKPNHAPPPLEKGKLVMRFFSSIEKGDYAAAARQGEKLSSMDKHNTSIMELIEIQQCNTYVRKAQEELNKGNLNDAMEIIQEGIESYPGNRTLPSYYSKLRQLRNAKRLLRNMEKARSASAKTSALAAAVTGLSRNQTKELNTYFDNYRKKIGETKKTVKAKSANKVTVNKKTSPVVKKPTNPKTATKVATNTKKVVKK